MPGELRVDFAHEKRQQVDDLFVPRTKVVVRLHGWGLASIVVVFRFPDVGMQHEPTALVRVLSADDAISAVWKNHGLIPPASDAAFRRDTMEPNCCFTTTVAMRKRVLIGANSSL